MATTTLTADLSLTSAWKGKDVHRHIVQFFDRDEVLLDSVCAFLSGGLFAGAGCVVIATKVHREQIENRLLGLGLDLQGAPGWKQYVALDAAETLSRFIVDGWPDAERFEEVVGPVIATLTDRHGRVIAFGEMVALLARGSQHSAAIELEKLWNALTERHALSVFCAYPVSVFDGDRDAQALADVCAQHSGVIG